MNDHPLLVPSLGCLSVPILYLLADGGFVRLNILGEEVEYPNVVSRVKRGTYVARQHIEIQ